MHAPRTGCAQGARAAQHATPVTVSAAGDCLRRISNHAAPMATRLAVSMALMAAAQNHALRTWLRTVRSRSSRFSPTTGGSQHPSIRTISLLPHGPLCSHHEPSPVRTQRKLLPLLILLELPCGKQTRHLAASSTPSKWSSAYYTLHRRLGRTTRQIRHTGQRPTMSSGRCLACQRASSWHCRIRHTTPQRSMLRGKPPESVPCMDARASGGARGREYSIRAGRTGKSSCIGGMYESIVGTKSLAG